MAGVLVYETLQRLHRYLASPLARVDLWVDDRELVVDCALVHPGEALDHFQIIRRVPIEPLKGMEVGGLDHERITLPMAPRVAHPRTDMLRQRHALAHADDTRVVDHLRQDHDVVGGLHNRIVVVVEVVRQHRRAGVGPERHQAAVGERSKLGVVERAELPIERTALGAPFARLSRQRRNAAVCGVRDERASRFAVVDGNPVAPIDIDVVVASRSTGGRVKAKVSSAHAAHWRRLAIGIAGGREHLDEFLARPLDLRHLVRGQYRANSPRAPKGCDRRVAPVPLEVRTTIGHTGHDPLPVGRRGLGRCK